MIVEMTMIMMTMVETLMMMIAKMTGITAKEMVEMKIR